MNINCDVGEGFELEEKIMPYIQSCNIACGGHTGNSKTMRKAVELAMKCNVKIGAHPSYPDKENFGRKTISLGASQFKESIQKQINSLVKILDKQNCTLNHIKPHGSLYNDIAKNHELSLHFLDAIEPYKSMTKLYVPYASIIAKNAKKRGLSIVYEAFADRNYNPDLTLVSRTNPDSLITNSEEVLRHVLNMISLGTVQTILKTDESIKASTFCVHIDTPNSLSIVKNLHKYFSQKHKITYKPYGERAVLIEWTQKIDLSILNDMRSFSERIKALNHKSIQDINFSYCSLLVELKSSNIPYKEIKSILKKTYYSLSNSNSEKLKKRWYIPVCYDKSFGLDLDLFATKNNCSIEKIIETHSSVNYTVYGIGFLPGFLYLGGLPEELHFLRKENPRAKIDKGSVAIGGEQTGIYPQTSPGGWQIIGKTPIDLFDARRKNPCEISPGDEIKFMPISLESFNKIKESTPYQLKNETI